MKLLSRLGFLYFLAFLLLGFVESARADSPHQLVLHFYASANRTGLPTRGLGIQPEDVYPDYDSCVNAGEKRLREYVPGVLPDGSMLLEYYGCEVVK